MALVDEIKAQENTGGQEATQQRPSLLVQHISQHGAEGLNQGYVNYALANGGGFGATAAGVVKDESGNLNPIYDFNRSDEEIAYAKARKRGENIDTWYSRAESESTAASERYETLKTQLDELNKSRNRALTASPTAFAVYKNAASQDEISHLEKALEQAQKAVERTSAEFSAAKAYRDYRDTTRPVEEAAERGVSYSDQYEAYSQSLDKLNKQREQLTQQLKDIRGGRAGYFGQESSDAQEKAEKETVDRLEKLEREIERIEGTRNYAGSRIGNDKATAAIIRQGEELSRNLRETWGNNNQIMTGMMGEGRAAKFMDKATRYAPNQNWTPEQMTLYNYLLAAPNHGPDDARNYAAQVNDALNRGTLNAELQHYENAGALEDRSGIVKAIGTAALLPAQVAALPSHALSYMEKLSDVLQGNPYVTNAVPTTANKIEAMSRGRARQLNVGTTLPDEIPIVGGKGAGDLFQLGQSAVESLVLGNMVGEAATLGSFFVQAADTTFDEAKSRGASDQYAAVMSILAGAAETAGEKIGLDHLLNGEEALAKGLGRYLLEQGLIEGGEEGVTNVLNQFGDRLASRITGNETKMQHDIRALVSQGMGYEDAERKVWKDFVDETLYDMFGGFISGTMSAGVQGPASIGNQIENKLWEMRKDSVLGKQNAEGKREGGKNASTEEIGSMIQRALERGDIRGAEQLMQELEKRNATEEPQEYGPADPNAGKRVQRRFERQLNGESLNPQEETVEAQNKTEVEQPPALPEEFKDLNPAVAQQYARYEGRDLEIIARSRPSREVYRYVEYLRAIGQNEKADLVDRYRTDPTFHYEEKAPAHTDEEDPMRYAPKNAAGASATSRDQITQPSQQNAAQAVKPGYFTTAENKLFNVTQNPYGVSTRSTENGTMAVPNTQEVNNNAGEQTVRADEAAEAADFGVGRRPAGAGAATGQYGMAQETTASEQGTQSGTERSAEKNYPRFVTEEDLATLSDTEESSPISAEQKEEYKQFESLLNDGTYIVSKPRIGTRLHLAMKLAKKLKLNMLFGRNANTSVYKDGASGYQNGNQAVIDADTTLMEVPTAVAHEAGHIRYNGKFGGFSNIVNGAFSNRLRLFTNIFNNALGEARGKEVMSIAEKFVREEKGYENKYRQSRNRLISRTNEMLVKSGRFLSQDSKKLVSEMEQARAVEEFLNQVLASDYTFLDGIQRKTDITWDEIYDIRDSLCKELVAAEIFDDGEIAAIDDAITALDEEKFAEDYADDDEFNAADFNSDLGRAVRKAAAGETSPMSDDELLAVLNYALDRAVPSSKGGAIAARLSELYDEYVKSSTSYIPEFGYRGRRIGTLSEGSAKSLMRTVSTAIGELSDRGIKFSSPDNSITDFANMFGAIADKNGNLVDIAYSEKKEDTREYDDGKGVMATEDEWYEKNAPRIKRDMQRGNDVVESFNSYQQNGTRRRDVPVSPAKTTQQVNGREVVDTGWIEPVKVSSKEVNQARAAVEAKGKAAELKSRINALEAQRDYLSTVADAMRHARSEFYGSGDIEQRKADLGYLAENAKDQLAGIREDLSKITSYAENADVSDAEAANLVSALFAAEDQSVVLTQQIESRLEGLRDEYMHLQDGDNQSLREVRNQITQITDQIFALSRQLSNVSERAEKADWGSNKRTLFQAEMAENPAAETEESVSRPPIDEPGYNKYVHELSYEERAEERLRRAKNAAKKEAERRKNADFESELRARTNEYEIVRNETDRSMNNKSNVPGYTLNPEAPTRTGIEPTTTSEEVRSITRARAEQIKQEEQLNKSFSKAIRRVTSKDLKGFNIAREMRQGMEDSYDNEFNAADFGEPARGMGTGYRGMQRSRNKDGSLEFRTMYDDAPPSRPATDKPRKPLNQPSTAYGNVAQAARSILNAKNSFFDFSEKRPKDIPNKVTNAMGQLYSHVREMMEGDHPVNALMQLSNLVHEFANDEDLKMFTSESIQHAVDELNDIYYNQDITNEEKARRMVENATKTLTLISKRVQLVDRSYTMLKAFKGPRKKRDGTTYWSKFKAMQLNPSTLFKALDGFDRRGGGSGYKIAKMIENGTALYTITQTQALKRLSEISGLEGFKEFAEGNAKPFDIDGVRITEQQAVEFIMQVRNLMNTAVTDKNGPTNRLNTIDGFSIKDKDGKTVFVERSDDADGTNAEWFKSLAEGFENSLSPAAKKYLETATEILDDLGQQASDIRTNLIGTGFEGSINGTYYPITYDNRNGTTYSQQNRQTSLADGPMYQSRTRNVGGYVSIKNASDTLDKYIHWASNFIGFGEVAELLHAMDNTGSRMQNLSGLANETLGQGYSDYIAKFVNDVNENSESQKNEFLARIRQNMASGALLGNLGVAAKQAASLWSAAGVLSPQALLAAETWFGGHTSAGNMLLQSRRTGTSIDPSISEILHNDSFMAKLMKRSGVSEFMGKATALVDYQTVKRLFAATVVDTKLSFPGMDQNSELFARTVEAKFQDVVLQTQPVFVKNARAGYLRSSDELTKAIAMFRTQPTQNLNAIATAIGEYRALKGTDFGKAAGKKLRNTIIGQASSAFTFALLSSVVGFARHGWKKYRDDDDELSLAEVAKRIGLDTVESLAGISAFGGDLAKAIITIATGGEEKEFYDLNAGVLSMVADTVTSVTTFGTNLVKAIREDKPLAVFNAGRQAVDNMLQVGAGIPANTIYRLLNAATMYTADAMYALSGGKLGNRANYDDAMKMLDSYIKGNLTEEGAKKQADKAFRKNQPENLLYNLGILSSLTSKDSKVDKGADWLNDRIQGKTEAERKAYKEDELARLSRNLNSGERIANYLADSALSAMKKDEAISKFATTSGYNVLYESLRAAGMTPKAAVAELGKTDNKTGLSTDIRDEDNLADLYAGKDNPGETNDVPALDKKNTDEYVNFVSAAKVFKDTGNYDQLDKLVDRYSRLDENTRAVIDAKDSTMKKYREYRSMGFSTKDYYNVKDAIKQAQIDLDLAANTGTVVKLVGLSKTNLTKAQVNRLINSDTLGISKTGKSLISVLSKYGYTIGDVGMFMYNTDWTNDDANGTLSQQEVVLALAKEKRLTDAQRSAIYEELKPLLRNEYKINHWYDKSYEYELNYLLQNGKTSGRAS